jgi:hypothetical protein
MNQVQKLKVTFFSLQIIPDDISKRLSGDLSDTDDSLDLSDVLDRAVPFHTLVRDLSN